jgi:hypothetical protein
VCNPALKTFSTPTPLKTSLDDEKLCKTGTATTVSYNSSYLKWTYTCRGSGDGSTSSCSVDAKLNAAPLPDTCTLKPVKELPFTTCKLNSSSFLNDYRYLSCLGIMPVKKTCAEAGCEKNAPRQELVSAAVRLRGIPLEPEYICQKNHTDTVKDVPSWVCEVVEKAQTAGLISATNKQFNPLSTMSRSEAYLVIMKSVCIYPGSTSSNWQAEVAKTAKQY